MLRGDTSVGCHSSQVQLQYKDPSRRDRRSSERKRVPIRRIGRPVREAQIMRNDCIPGQHERLCGR
jgi:hypothetical protein